LVEPIFRRGDIIRSGAPPKIYDHQSDTSGKRVSVNFCAACGASIYLEFERFPDVLGLFGGTFDDPNWFARTSGICRHIFTRSAQDGVVLPAGVATFEEHAQQLDGTPNQPGFLGHASMVSRK